MESWNAVSPVIFSVLDLSSGLDSVLARTTARLLVRESGNSELSFWAKGTCTRPLTATRCSGSNSTYLIRTHPHLLSAFRPHPTGFLSSPALATAPACRLLPHTFESLDPDFAPSWIPPPPRLSSVSRPPLAGPFPSFLLRHPYHLVLLSDPSTPVLELSGRDIADPSCRLGKISQDLSARNPVGPLPTAATSHHKATKPLLSSPHRQLPECHMRASGVRRF